MNYLVKDVIVVLQYTFLYFINKNLNRSISNIEYISINLLMVTFDFTTYEILKTKF